MINSLYNPFYYFCKTVCELIKSYIFGNNNTKIETKTKKEEECVPKRTIPDIEERKPELKSIFNKSLN